MMRNEKFKLIIKATLAHVLTYMICGVLAMNIFNYGDFTEALGFRPIEEIHPAAFIFAQLVRGVLFGFVVLWIKDSVIGVKLGWLKLWGVLVIVGIFNTYGPAMGSIEGMIYLEPIDLGDVSPFRSLLSMLEILIQPLLFSLIVTFKRNPRMA